MPAFVYDIEADNLLEDVTKIHCLCYTPLDELNVTALTSYEDIIKFVTQDDLTLIAHNGVSYDAEVLKKILGVEIKARLVDTLGISYYLHSSDGRQKHGLESYGEEYGVPKPKVDDWENLTLAEYVNRATEDVKINYQLWKDQQSYLKELYNGDTAEIIRLLEYITFKYECLVEQNKNRIKLDVSLAVDEMLKLEELVEEKRAALLTVMPEVVKYKTVSRPKKMEKADGSLSVQGQKWLDLLEKEGHDKNSDIQELEVVDYREDANPDSTTQIKDWLFKLNWVPQHYKFVRNKVTGETKQIPQITSEQDKTQICPSIVDLAEQVPELQHLAGYSTVKHRLTIIKGFFRDSDKDGRLVADAMGWTNTFRLKHRVLVNLPKPTAPYAENIRACLIADEGHYMVGTDLSGIEDACKRISIYPIDPDYVNEMQHPDFDAHTSVAVAAGLMTEDDEVFFKLVDKTEDRSVFSKEELARYKALKLVRQDSKIVNFSSIYNVGAKTLARNMKKTEKEARNILDAYWKKNKAVKQFAQSLNVKTVRGQMWLQQPLSRFWYTLRNDRDRFSTCNQGNAVYIFDMWGKHIREQGLKMSYQSHDEWLMVLPNEFSKDKVKEIINNAIQKVNELIDSPVKIGCSVDFGFRYSDVH